jgi:hypothetical protein
MMLITREKTMDSIRSRRRMRNRRVRTRVSMKSIKLSEMMKRKVKMMVLIRKGWILTCLKWTRGRKRSLTSTELLINL